MRVLAVLIVLVVATVAVGQPAVRGGERRKTRIRTIIDDVMGGLSNMASRVNSGIMNTIGTQDPTARQKQRNTKRQHQAKQVPLAYLENGEQGVPKTKPQEKPKRPGQGPTRVASVRNFVNNAVDRITNMIPSQRLRQMVRKRLDRERK